MGNGIVVQCTVVFKYNSMFIGVGYSALLIICQLKKMSACTSKRGSLPYCNRSYDRH